VGRVEEQLRGKDATYYGNYVSVVVLSYGRMEQLHNCLKSIWLNTKYPYELIINDDGSQPEIQEYLFSKLQEGKLSSLVLAPPGHNMGVGVSTNRGFQLAHGNLLVKLDADMQVEAGWLEDAVRAFNAFPELAWWGFARYPHGTVEATRKTFIKEVTREGLAIQVHMKTLSGAFMVRRDTWEVNGPLIEFNTSFSEDINFQAKCVPAMWMAMDGASKERVWAQMELDGRWLGAPVDAQVKVREQQGVLTKLWNGDKVPTPIHFSPPVLGDLAGHKVELTLLRGLPVRPWNYVDRPDLLEIIRNG